MTATILPMGDYRTVFVLPTRTGLVVYMATYGFGRPHTEAHHRAFKSIAKADAYVRELSQHFGCAVRGDGLDGSEDTKHG